MAHLDHEVVEQLAALILVIGGGIFLAIAFRARPTQPGSAALAAARPGGRPTTEPGAGRSLAIILAGLSAGAAAIHLAAAPSHFTEIGDLAAGFVVSAIFQAAWIRWCLAGPSRGTAWVGIAGNLAIVAAWAWTRTVGLPVGELAGMPEPVGFPDGASVVFELLLVAGLAARLVGLGTWLTRRVDLRTVESIAVVPVLGLVLVLTSLATVAIASGLEHGSADAPHAMSGHVAAP